MPRKRPEGWKPKREPRVTLCKNPSCQCAMWPNQHHCNICGMPSYAWHEAELRKNLKGK